MPCYYQKYSFEYILWNVKGNIHKENKDIKSIRLSRSGKKDMSEDEGNLFLKSEFAGNLWSWWSLLSRYVINIKIKVRILSNVLYLPSERICIVLIKDLIFDVQMKILCFNVNMLTGLVDYVELKGRTWLFIYNGTNQIKVGIKSKSERDMIIKVPRKRKVWFGNTTLLCYFGNTNGIFSQHSAIFYGYIVGIVILISVTIICIMYLCLLCDGIMNNSCIVYWIHMHYYVEQCKSWEKRTAAQSVLQMHLCRTIRLRNGRNFGRVLFYTALSIANELQCLMHQRKDILKCSHYM